jgi:hypothetical protein
MSALPMVYYMAARYGVDSLMDKRLPQSAKLPPDILQTAIKGLMALREMERDETYRLVMGLKTSHTCSSAESPSRKTTAPRTSDAHRKVIERITGSSQSGTKVLQVLSLSGIYGSDSHGFCENCVKGWEVGHAEVRRRAWSMLPIFFGLEG